MATEKEGLKHLCKTCEKRMDRTIVFRASSKQPELISESHCLITKGIVLENTRVIKCNKYKEE